MVKRDKLRKREEEEDDSFQNTNKTHESKIHLLIYIQSLDQRSDDETIEKSQRKYHNNNKK
jgi:hypothetical protein